MGFIKLCLLSGRVFLLARYRISLGGWGTLLSTFFLSETGNSLCLLSYFDTWSSSHPSWGCSPQTRAFGPWLTASSELLMGRKVFSSVCFLLTLGRGTGYQGPHTKFTFCLKNSYQNLFFALSFTWSYNHALLAHFYAAPGGEDKSPPLWIFLLPSTWSWMRSLNPDVLCRFSFSLARYWLEG